MYTCIKFCLLQCFSLSVTGTYMSTYRSRLFVVDLHCLNMALFVGSQSYISPPSFMFVSAAVSEMCDLNQNKKKRRRNLKLALFPI